MKKNIPRERFEMHSNMLVSLGAKIGIFELGNIFFRSTREDRVIKISQHIHENLFEISIMHHGEMNYQILEHNVTIDAQQGNIVLIPADIAHTRTCYKEGAEIVGFQFELAERSRSTLHKSVITAAITKARYTSKGSPEVKAALSTLYGELKSQRPLTMIMRELKAKILLVAMLRNALPDLFLDERKNFESSHEGRLFRQIDMYINDHLEESRYADKIAKLCQISERQLNRIFQAKLKTTLGEYVFSKKMNYAKIQLANTSKSIKSIAFDLGFSSPSHFISRFKKICKQTPLQYRSTLISEVDNIDEKQE